MRSGASTAAPPGARRREPVPWGLPVTEAAAAAIGDVLGRLHTSERGLSGPDAAHRLAVTGPNAVRSHGASALAVFTRQLRSPLLALLVAAAVTAGFVHQTTNAIIIGILLAVSVGLGFGNEFRAERAAAALHSRVRHEAVVVRGGSSQRVDVTDLVPGDVVDLRLGEVVPADLRLLEATGLECDESVLTGESMPVHKATQPVAAGSPTAELTSCALMGTVVRAGSGRGVVVSTGAGAEFGRIALDLGERQPETEFQLGLRAFSALLVRVAAVLTAFVLGINLVLRRPVLDAVLFSLAIAVGITPQLLPAVVSTSLAVGARRLANAKVLVKRLICIEDLGNIQVLFTDKTGTLTEGRIRFARALGTSGADSEDALLLGLVCNEAVTRGTHAVAGNPLDVALWQSPAAKRLGPAVAGYRRRALLSFDHERLLVSVVVDDPDGRSWLVTKGAPEAVLGRCGSVEPETTRLVEQQFAAGARLVAVGRRPWHGTDRLAAADETGLEPVGLLVFDDPLKRSAAPALRRLAGLGIDVKVVTGDHPVVAARACAELGLAVGSTLTGADVDRMDDTALGQAVTGATVIARVSPEQKARIVRVHREQRLDVAFVGDGVNDALALHAADVGISVDSATDVAKDAADIILLEKDLGVLADGVVEGRRIFANTIKYVLMGTSSNFGNMASAAGASALLPFLPMLPSQVLLNNLLYDSSQLAIPTDTVDEEQLRAPAHWDVHMIRRYMLLLGPISSLFDFTTFAVLLGVFHAHAALFRSGWFVESLATQTLVIFVIRTRRSPFIRSRPGAALVAAALAVVALGTALPYTPVADDLGLRPLPVSLALTVFALVAGYLVLVESVKTRALQVVAAERVSRRVPGTRRLHRRAARFSSPQPFARGAVGPDGADRPTGGVRPPRAEPGRSRGPAPRATARRRP